MTACAGDDAGPNGAWAAAVSAESPPRRPRGARRWPWLATGALAAALYVSAYVGLREASRLVPFSWPQANEVAPREQILETRVMGGRGGVRLGSPTSWRRLFRPCIAVEEWWRNR